MPSEASTPSVGSGARAAASTAAGDASADSGIARPANAAISSRPASHCATSERAQRNASPESSSSAASLRAAWPASAPSTASSTWCAISSNACSTRARPAADVGMSAHAACTCFSARSSTGRCVFAGRLSRTSDSTSDTPMHHSGENGGSSGSASSAMRSVISWATRLPESTVEM